MNKNSRTSIALASVLILAAACSVKESPPPALGDAGVDTGFSVVPAGSIGTCIPTEPVKGYRTCLMSEPQHQPAITVGQGRQSALKLPPPLPAADTLPSKVDHRADYMSGCMKVHSQGKCGWCTAHATNASLEAMLCKSKQAHQRISEPHLWWLGKERSDFADCKGGWYISSAFSTLGYMTDQGYLLVRGSLWPYVDNLAQMNSTRPTSAVLKQQGQYGAPASKVFYMPPRDVGALKAALAAGNNVVYSVPVFKNTGWDWYNSNFGAIDAPSPEPPGLCKCSSCPTETHCLSGYHAILIVGYDDKAGNAGAFRFLNSWGSWWGSGGYGTVSYKLISKYGQGGRYASGLKTNVVINKPPVADAALPDTAPQPDVGPRPPDAALPDTPQPDAGPPPPDAALPDAALPDAPLPDAMLPDAVLPDAALPDLSPPTPDAPTPVQNALCTSPQPINLTSGPVSVLGNTVGAANQFGLSIACGLGLSFDAAQRYYRVTLKGGVTYTIKVKPSGWDAAVYLFWDKACSSASTINSQCASYVSDTWGGDHAESFTIKPNYSYDFIVAVDSYDPSAAGPFTLSVSW